MPKPLHPATVHFPIAFLLLSTSLDTLSHLHPTLPSTLTTHLPFTPTDLSKIAYHLSLLGLLTILPALSTGILELLSMLQKQGLYQTNSTGQKTIRAKVKVTLLHAAVNDIVLAGMGYIAYQRYTTASSLIASGKKVVLSGEGVYTAENWQVWGQLGLMGLMLFGANLGGNLTYLHGVGLSAGGSTAKGKKGQ